MLERVLHQYQLLEFSLIVVISMDLVLPPQLPRGLSFLRVSLFWPFLTLCLIQEASYILEQSPLSYLISRSWRVQFLINRFLKKRVWECIQIKRYFCRYNQVCSPRYVFGKTQTDPADSANFAQVIINMIVLMIVYVEVQNKLPFFILNVTIKNLFTSTKTCAL